MDDLKRLKAAANDACDLAQQHSKDFPGEAINWGDLGCSEAGYYRTDNGDEGYYVVLEEASPSTSAFRMFIIRELAARDWPNVEVRTEW